MFIFDIICQLSQLKINKDFNQLMESLKKLPALELRNKSTGHWQWRSTSSIIFKSYISNVKSKLQSKTQLQDSTS